MKTYKELTEELDEVLGFAARKAVGRRMKMLAKKASTKMKKKLNKMRALSHDKAKQKAQKSVRKTFMQKIAGKGKDLASMSLGQKANLEKKVDKKMKSMGSRVQALVKKASKKMVKKHRAAKQAALAAKASKK
jgi:hypothetical protein